MKGRNIAIAEWKTATGPADYVLFAGLAAIGVVEAKRHATNVQAALGQAARYACGFAAMAQALVYDPNRHAAYYVSKFVGIEADDYEVSALRRRPTMVARSSVQEHEIDIPLPL